MESVEAILAKLLWAGGNMKEAPKKTVYHTKHYQLIIGIGDNHTATITVDEESLKELCVMRGYTLNDFVEVGAAGSGD